MKYWPFVLILVFFLVTRIVSLANDPLGPYWDEASIGYNAHSLIVAGKDEWGTRWPVNFRAFGEFKLPVYIYTVAFFEMIIGLNAWAIRLPAVFFSLGVVTLVYMICLRVGLSRASSAFSSFVISTSPWFFIISRTGYEATAGLFFYMLGLYLILVGKNKSLPFAAIGFVLSMHSYNSFRLVVPATLVILLLLCIYYHRKRLVFRSKEVIVSAFIVLVGVLPIIKSYLTGDVSRRIGQISIFNSDKDTTGVLNTFLANFFSHIDPSFLFINGDSNYRSHYVGYGELFWIILVFIVFGLMQLYRRSKRLFILVGLFSVIFTLPAAITTEAPHSLRTLSLVALFSFISAFGYEYLTLRKYSKYILGTLIVVNLLLFGNYYKDVLINYPKLSSDQWQYSYNILFNKTDFDKYKNIYVTDYYSQPYIFALYNLKFNPEVFWETVEYNSPDKWGMSTVSKFDKFYFTFSKEGYSENSLIVSEKLLEIESLTEISRIKDLDGDVSLYLYEN